MPARILKFHIVDLAPEKSLIKYLVEQLHTMLCISWKSATAFRSVADSPGVCLLER